MMTKQQTEALESMVDSASLTDVVDALVSICRDKAEHLRANWQDESSAKLWDSNARKLERVSGRFDE